MIDRSDGIELSILAAPSDLPFVQPTVEHQLAALRSCDLITRRVLVLDLGLESTERREERDELVRMAETLASNGRIDSWRAVDWSEQTVRATMKRWYGDSDAPPTAGRRAIYQYLFAIDSSEESRVIHLDSDMLIHGRNARWIERAHALFGERTDVVAVEPSCVPPQATRLAEWVFGRGFDVPTYEVGWSFSNDFTSRSFLLDRQRAYDGLLPLPTVSAGANWEIAMRGALRLSTLTKGTYIDSQEYFLHPRRHNDNHRRHVRHLIDLVERGRYPYRRLGYPWDITTEGRRFIPWQLLMLRDRLGGRTRLEPKATVASARAEASGDFE